MGGSTDRQGFAWTLVAPVLVIELGFVAAPLLLGFWYSLHRADYFQLGEWRGLANYAQVLADPLVLESLAATTIFTAFSLAITFVIGFALALRLEPDRPSSVALRAVVLVPYVISMLVGSLLLKWVFSSDSGVLDLMLAPLGLGGISVFSDPRSAMAALVFNAVWRDSAFAMILLLAGLKSMPAALHAAARVDGAGPVMRFMHITLPLLRVPILITVLRLGIHLINELTFALVLTGGGPNNATLTMGLTLYRMGFVDFRIGQASAFAIILFLFNLCIVGVLLRLFRERQQGLA